MSTTAGTAPTFSADRVVTSLEVPVNEPAERSIPVAAWLAETWDLPIRLLNVSPSVGPAPGESSRTESNTGGVDLDAVAGETTSRWPDLSIGSKRLDGDDVATAVAAAAGAGADTLLVVATDNANAWSFKNSVAERLVDRVRAPIVLVGPRADQPNRGGDIVAAFDGRPAAQSALDGAATLALALGRNLWLVQVIAEPLAGEVELHPEFGLEMDRRVGNLDPRIGARWEVIHSNDPINAIEAFADRIAASFIVAAARGRIDETRTTMSSITMGLVAAAARPVLVVHH